MSFIPLLVERIDAVLPQTQCGQCGYNGCLPYATALAQGEVEINRCPPGGEAGIHTLAELLHKPYQPFEPDAPQPKPRALAVIDETTCIGCTLCLQACPVDAILGAAKQMHTIIASECTGCELCIAPCPVDCISMQALDQASLAVPMADHWRQRHRFHQFRLERDKAEKAQRLADKSAAKAMPAIPAAQASDTSIKATSEQDKKAAIAAAMQRAAEQRAAQKPAPAGNEDAKQAAIQAAMEKAAARKAAAAARAAEPEKTHAGLSDADKKALIQAAMQRAAQKNQDNH